MSNMVGVGPRQDLPLGQRWQMAHVPHAAMPGKQVEQRFVTGEAAEAASDVLDDLAPGLPAGIRDHFWPMLLLRPLSGSRVKGVRPGQHLAHRQGWEIGKVANTAMFRENLR
ncbi:MAG: hypothetical protein C0501_02290 [Isosphaera sp.]|nr:hypothetical protein [Isosphaera sp.]